jgi:hypothetical protein
MSSAGCLSKTFPLLFFWAIMVTGNKIRKNNSFFILIDL